MSTNPLLKQPSTLMDMSAGPTYTQVLVSSIDPNAMPPIATCVDNAQRQFVVRMDIQRGKGSLPTVGETWVIDKTLGTWTFAAIVNAHPGGVSALPSTDAVTGLSEALSSHDADLATHDQRLDTMWSQGTISATQGTTADVTLTDGTVIPAAQAVGSYAPTVGDTVWTGQVDAAGGRVVLGTNASATSAAQMGSATIGPWGVSVDQNNNPALVSSGKNTALIAGANGLYVTNAGNTAPASLHAAGWDLQPDSVGNTSLLSSKGGSGIVSTGGIVYAVQAGNTLNHAPLVASTITSDTTLSGTPIVSGTFVHALSDVYADGKVTAGANITAGTNITVGTTIMDGAGFGGGHFISGATTVDNTGMFGNQINGLGAAFGGVGITSGGITAPGKNISTDANGSMNSLNYYGGTFHGVLVASERRLKDHVSIIDDGLDVIRKLVGAKWRWKDGVTNGGGYPVEQHPGRVHIGVYVDEVAEHAPDAVHEEPAQEGGTTGNRIYEDRALIAYLVSAAQTLADRNDALEKRLAALEAPVREEEPPTKE